MHTKLITITLLLCGWTTLSYAQTNHGFSFDNYSGIYGVISNPANSVDSKYDIHINVLSYNQLGASDIGTLTNFQVETAPNGFNGLEFEKNLMKGKNEGYAFGHSDILLPSVVWNFHEKYAVGLLLRSRSIFDYNKVNSKLLQGAKDGFTEEFTFDNKELNNTAHNWGEIGLNLSTILINTNYHFVKFGGTFKYYFGNRATEVRGSLRDDNDGTDLALNTDDDPLISLNTSTLTGESDTSKLFINSAIENFSGKGTGIGGDIGLVYEWRPRETNRVDVRSNSSAVNKYKLKISASVLDIGTIKYESTTNSRIIQNSISLSGLNINVASYDSNKGLITSILEQQPSVEPAQGEVTFALPMLLNLNLDYIILNNNNYYINVNYIKGLTTASNQFANTQMDLITVTPRYETRKFSAYLPINFQPLTGEIAAGLGVRYGPVTVGAAALSSMFLDGKMSHLYFGVSIPLMKELNR